MRACKVLWCSEGLPQGGQLAEVREGGQAGGDWLQVVEEDLVKGRANAYGQFFECPSDKSELFDQRIELANVSGVGTRRAWAPLDDDSERCELREFDIQECVFDGRDILSSL